MAVFAVAVVLIAGCSSNNNKTNNNNRSSAATPRPAGATPAPTPAAAAVKPMFAKAPNFSIDPNKGYVADMKTDKGDIIIELNAKAAPLTVNNFVFLARQHFYDSLTCHRVIPGFVAQCGDPTGTGGGGPGYTIPDENSPLKHGVGAVAMAKTNQPNSAGSQFYITFAPQPSLDGKYTVFGQVISGMDVVQQLTPRDPSGSPPPATPGDRIISMTIMETNATPTPFAGGAAPGALPPAPTPAR